MKLRRLGQTEIVVSELAFGCLAIGGGEHGEGYGPADDAASKRAIHAALDMGCKLFDTADVYGHGRSERVLGSALWEARTWDAVVATKGGCDFSSGQVLHNFAPAYLITAVDSSRRRLRRECIDIYQLHNPPLAILKDPAIPETLAALKEAGRIRRIGVSVHTCSEALSFARADWVDVVQIVYNLFCLYRPEMTAESCLNELSATGKGLIAREPLGNGYLTGKIRRSTTFQRGDWRLQLSQDQRNVRADLAQSLSYLSTSGVSMTQAALRFVLDEPRFCSSIVGIENEEQARECFAAVDIMPFEQIVALSFSKTKPGN